MNEIFLKRMLDETLTREAKSQFISQHLNSITGSLFIHYKIHRY